MTAPSSRTRMITGLFADEAGAERGYQACVERGYEIGAVNVVMAEETRNRLLAEGTEVGAELASHKAEGGELGGPHGGGVGMLVTASAAVGAAVLVPALGLVAGPIAVALAAAGAAGAAAGLIGLLSDWGVPDERIGEYRAGIDEGGILMMVEVGSEQDARHIEQQWRALGAGDVHRT
ncbi:MAG TPA: hypothetical protein VFG21_03865 [Xanthomonadaceae bacterium]|nr:hypothetical protein [Xanthomonadaceae bacterium]